jgi:hypothetical protein
MNLLGGEPLITLRQAAKHFPLTQGKGLHMATVFRWIRDGVLGPNRTRIRLEAVKVGSRWLTSIAALERFVERQTPTFDDGAEPIRTAGQTASAAARAGAELEAVGI